jgi:hypothetical protein
MGRRRPTDEARAQAFEHHVDDEAHDADDDDRGIDRLVLASALNRRSPTPCLRAIISLVTIVMSASTSPVRMPTTISGNAAGSTTRNSRRRAFMPIAAADHSIFCSTARAP